MAQRFSDRVVAEAFKPETRHEFRYRRAEHDMVVLDLNLAMGQTST
jgi:hypothetical protein